MSMYIPYLNDSIAQENKLTYINLAYHSPSCEKLKEHDMRQAITLNNKSSKKRLFQEAQLQLDGKDGMKVKDFIQPEELKHLMGNHKCIQPFPKGAFSSSSLLHSLFHHYAA